MLALTHSACPLSLGKLVISGCNAKGEKRLLALETASSKHNENWEVLLDGLRVRGLRDPRLAIAEGVGGFWKALHKVSPATRHQRFWMYNARNLAAMLLKKHQKKAHVQLRDVWKAMDADGAKEGAEKFIGRYGRKYPEIADSLRKDLAAPHHLRLPRRALEVEDGE